MSALVLTRFYGQAVCIGSNVRISILEVGRGQVKLRIEAPLDISIDREEIRERKEIENENFDPGEVK